VEKELKPCWSEQCSVGSAVILVAHLSIKSLE
jgi:hypothetical protein